MKRILFLAAVAALAGCVPLTQQIAGDTPSLQYCSHVEYVRNGAEIKVLAVCQAPIGGSAVVLPIPPVTP